MEDSNEFFEISAVSRLTGISPHVLRVWERRYGVVEPRRSDTKRRRYSSGDIQRLALLKTLVDNGHSIGSVANLSTRQLQERITTVLGSDCPDELSGSSSHGDRIAVIGTKIRQAAREMVETSEKAKLVGEFVDLDEFERSLRIGAVDVVIYEKDTLFAEEVQTVRAILIRNQVQRIVFVYHFASEDVLRGLDADGCVAMRAPADPNSIRQACELLPTPIFRSGGEGRRVEMPDLEGEIPPRAFSDQQLAKVATLNSVIECECPQHIGHLIAGLFAFEQYSEQCENRNEQDAELHAFLHRATAQCRSQMESALAKVLAEEGFTL